YLLLTFHDATLDKNGELQALAVARAESALAETQAQLRQREDALRDGPPQLEESLRKLQRSATRLARYNAASGQADVQRNTERAQLLAHLVERRTEDVQRTIRDLADFAAIQTDS